MASDNRISFHEQLFFHVALPRNVPAREDRNLHALEGALLERLTNASRLLCSKAVPQHQPQIRGLYETLVDSKSLNVDGTIPKSALLRGLRDLKANKMLILHTKAQNAALLVFKSKDDEAVFEVFETSASCKKVLASSNALLWPFPGSSVAIPDKTYSEPSFQEGFADFMQKAASEHVVKFASMSIKAGTAITEIRDTSSPDVLSGLLTAILEANGAVRLTTKLLQKRVRDEVRFDDAERPWRRSPFYLVSKM